jgi:hypothetical protein
MEVYELNATKKRKQPIKNANGKNEWPQSPVGNRFKGMEVNASMGKRDEPRSLLPLIPWHASKCGNRNEGEST